MGAKAHVVLGVLFAGWMKVQVRTMVVSTLLGLQQAVLG
jgi:hypothetical protein